MDQLWGICLLGPQSQRDITETARPRRHSQAIQTLLDHSVHVMTQLDLADTVMTKS